MDRTVMAVLALVLGTPVLAALALVAQGSVEPEIIYTSLMFGVPMVFAVAALFEIRRIAGVDDQPSEQGLLFEQERQLKKAKTYEKVESPATEEVAYREVVPEPEAGPVPPPGYSLDERTERPVDESITRPAPEPRGPVAEAVEGSEEEVLAHHLAKPKVYEPTPLEAVKAETVEVPAAQRVEEVQVMDPKAEMPAGEPMTLTPEPVLASPGEPKPEPEPEPQPEPPPVAAPIPKKGKRKRGGRNPAPRP